MNIKSIFEQISEQVFVMADLNEAKIFVINFVQDKGINDKDKNSIVNAVKECKSLVRLQTYICNSLLKYEGMSVSTLNKSARSAAADTAK